MPEAEGSRSAHWRGGPRVALVVARTRPGNVIGRDNQLPWRLRSDLRRFRRITLGHPVIMGRRTYESIGHPLPRRLNIVVSSAAPAGAVAASAADGTAVRVRDIAAAMQVVEAHSFDGGRKDVFVIGGARLFETFLEADLVDRVYLTEVLAPDLAGDTHFAREFPPDRWTTSNVEELPPGEHDDYATCFRLLTRAE